MGVSSRNNMPLVAREIREVLGDQVKGTFGGSCGYIPAGVYLPCGSNLKNEGVLGALKENSLLIEGLSGANRFKGLVGRQAVGAGLSDCMIDTCAQKPQLSRAPMYIANTGNGHRKAVLVDREV